MFTKISLVDQVYEKLRSDIIHLRLPLGSRINVNELQQVLGVSCTPIREAINRLQQEGLVSYKNNAGANVLSLDANDLREILELSESLAFAAVHYSMLRSNRDEIADELEVWRNAYAKAESEEELVQSVHHFFGIFYHKCDNRRLDDTMVSIHGLQLLLRNIYARAGAEKSADLEDLGRIIESVRKDCQEEVFDLIKTLNGRMEKKIASTL